MRCCSSWGYIGIFYSFNKLTIQIKRHKNNYKKGQDEFSIKQLSRYQQVICGIMDEHTRNKTSLCSESALMGPSAKQMAIIYHLLVLPRSKCWQDHCSTYLTHLLIIKKRYKRSCLCSAKYFCIFNVINWRSLQFKAKKNFFFKITKLFLILDSVLT